MGRPQPPIPLEFTCCNICRQKEATTVAQGFDYEYWTTDQQFRLVQCIDCGHLFLNPRPTKAAAARIYPQNYYTLEGRHTKGSSRLVALAKGMVIRNRLSFGRELLKGGCQVLEIGCGDCSLILDLKASYPETRITGVDLVLSDSARGACAAQGIALIEGAIEDVPLTPETFDLVIMNQLIEHLWDPQFVLQKIHGALRPGGFLSIETPNVSGYDRPFFTASFWGGYYFPRHLNLFSFDSLARLLRQTGFEVVVQRSLLAPIIWANSFIGYFCPTPETRPGWAAWFFTDRNPLCLGVFSVVDLIAILLGLVTSNQKTIARKVSWQHAGLTQVEENAGSRSGFNREARGH